MIKRLKSHYVVLILATPTKTGSIYLGNPKRDTYRGAQRCFIYKASDDCKIDMPRGATVFVSDAFELDDFKSCKGDLESSDFDELRRFEELTESYLETKIVHEDSIIAIDDPAPVEMR